MLADCSTAAFLVDFHRSNQRIAGVHSLSVALAADVANLLRAAYG